LYSATNGNFSCSGAVRHRHRRRTDYKPCTLSPRGHGTLTYDEQSYAALVCRLMVSTPVIHVITWTTNHLLTRRDGRLSWPGWLTHSGHYTHGYALWDFMSKISRHGNIV